jgi:hypothetical protein
MPSHRTQFEQIAADTKLVAGVQTYFAPGNVTVTVGGVVLTSAQLVTTLQSRVNATNARTTAKANLVKAVADGTTLLATTQPIVETVKQVVLMNYSNQPDVLTVFGVSPRKVPVALTLEEKAAKAAKAAATRIARNTMGPKQKAKVKGVVPTAAPAAK